MILNDPLPFVILTEENPQPEEILHIMSMLNVSAKMCSITPCVSENTASGSFVATTDTGLSCIIRLFGGTTASVDYIVIDTETNDPILLLESTKTEDSSSRNSAWFQRLTKFAVCSRMFPNVRKAIYYTQNMIPTSSSYVFGMKLATTMGVEVWHPGGQMLSPKFSTVSEIIADKNNLAASGPKHNQPVTLSLEGNTMTISGRLNKTDGRMDYDPNIGLFLGIINSVAILDSSIIFRISDHKLDITKVCANNKFWYGVRGISVTLDGFESPTVELPSSYYTLKMGCEKFSTILFQHISGLPVAFHNHAGCQRSHLIALDGSKRPVPKKITMPDLVLIDENSKNIFLVEGKDASKVTSAQTQLDELDPFENICVTAYPGYTVNRGLCLYANKPIKDLRYPVWFVLEPSGVFTKTFPA
jgi:hypothetical protein